MNQEVIRSRVFFYCGICIFLLEHFIPVFYQFKGINETILLILLMVLIGYSKWGTISRTTQKSILGIILVLFFSFLIRLGHTGIGSIQTLLFCILQYLFLYKIKLSPKDYTIATISFFLFLLVYRYAPLNAYNTNTIGYTWGALGIYSTLLIKNNKLLFLSLISFYIILQIHLSDSRTAIIAFVIYITIRYIPYSIFQNKYILFSIMLALTFGGLLYVYSYIYMYENSIDVSWTREYSEKRFFSGRQFIWMEILDLLHEHPFTGIGSHVTLRSFKYVNIHNSALNFCAIYGYIVGSLVLYIIVKSVMTLRKYMDNYIIKNCFAGFVFFLIISFSETNLIFESFSTLIPLCIAYSEFNRIRSNKLSQSNNHL